MIEFSDAMQRDVDNSKVKYSLTNNEVVADFPKGKSVVKRLIKETEDFLEKIEQEKQLIREGRNISMFDIDIVTKLTMAAIYGNEIEQAEENLKRLKRLLIAYDPPPVSKDAVTDADIERARQFPIRQLVKTRGNNTLCLWHNDRHPSMHLYKDNHAYCFVCSKYANAIDFAMQMNSMQFIPAVQWLLRV